MKKHEVKDDVLTVSVLGFNFDHIFDPKKDNLFFLCICFPQGYVQCYPWSCPTYAE